MVPGGCEEIGSPRETTRAGNLNMKKILGFVLLAGIAASTLGGCAYAGVAASGDKAVIARNDGFLFGILRKVYVCKISDSGVTACQSNEAP